MEVKAMHYEYPIFIKMIKRWHYSEVHSIRKLNFEKINSISVVP